MAQSQKFMMYIVPFFSLTGLYWQYGLVLYWVTTNLWTLGQQYLMFRNWEPTAPRPRWPADRGCPGAARRGPAELAASGLGASGLGASGTARGPRDPVPPRRPPAGAGLAAPRTGSAAGDAKAGTASGRPAPAGSGSARVKSGTAASSGQAGQRIGARADRDRGRPPRPPRRPPRPPGRMARKSAGCCDWAGETRSLSPRTTCPPLRWSGSNRCGRREASGRASGDGYAKHSGRSGREPAGRGGHRRGGGPRRSEDAEDAAGPADAPSS